MYISQKDEGAVLQGILDRADVKRPPFWQRFRTRIAVALVVLLSILYILINLLLHQAKWLESLTAITGSFVFAIGYLQWRAARHEITFDKYYDKLDLVNRKFDAWREETLRERPKDLQDHRYTMFVFAELDNLEYIIEKYKLGYVSREFMERGLRTFIARCEEQGLYEDAGVELFRDRAKNLLGVAKGFEETTRNVVGQICEYCNQRRSGHQQG